MPCSTKPENTPNRNERHINQAHPRALQSRGHGGLAGNGHLSQPGMHFQARTRHHAKSGAFKDPDGMGVQPLRRFICRFRSSGRVVGGPDRDPQTADCYRFVVVGIHDGDCGGNRLRVHAGRPVSLRRRRGWCLALCGEDIFPLDSPSGARNDPRHLLYRSSRGGRPHSAAGDLDAGLYVVADGVSLLRTHGLHLGHCLVCLVSRQPGRPGRREPGGIGLRHGGARP